MLPRDFLQRRKVAKWHEQVNSVAGDIRPAPIAVSVHQGHLFPYAQLATFTKEYLGKKKQRTQDEKDLLLEELIRTHSPVEVAFAACVRELSTGAIDKFLTNFFLVDPKTLHGLPSYLQAFVSAAQGRQDTFSADDQIFAITIVPVATDVLSQQLQPAHAESLFGAWNICTPSNRLLLQRAKILTRNVCQRMEAELNQFQNQLKFGALTRDACARATRYGQLLSRLRIANPQLEECLTVYFSAWRGWANWVPNKARLLRWAESKQSPLDCLIELEGPDLSLSPQENKAEWQALIRRGVLLDWLESRGFVLDIGLITTTTEAELTTFINTLLDVTNQATQARSTQLLQYFIGRDGLDVQPLIDWQAVQAVLDPRFIALLLPRKAAYPEDADQLLVRGLHTLFAGANVPARSPFQQEIAQFVTFAANTLVRSFATNLASNVEWMSVAKRLWELRTTVAASAWLHANLDAAFVRLCLLQAERRTLAGLCELYAVVKAQERVGSVLTALFDIYIHNFVKHGVYKPSQTTAFPRLLHNLWLRVQNAEIRSAALAIASIDGLDMQYQRACITQLQHAPDNVAQDLRQCLAALPDERNSQFIELTRVTASLYSPRRGVCWQALLLWAFKRQRIHIDAPQFTSLGFWAYRRWIMKLHALFGNSIESLSSLNGWLTELDEVRLTLEVLEVQDNSTAAMHLLLTGHQYRRRYMDMLRSLHQQTDKDTIELMREIVLSLNKSNYTAVSRTILSLAKLNQAGLAQCQRLMRICHESRDVGATRLAIWLRMSVFSDKTETALANLGQVLQLGLDNELKPSKASLDPARRDYAKQAARMIALADRLERSRAMLKRKHPQAIQNMVDELGLEQPRGADSLMADLPIELVDVVEATADDQVELHISLSDPDLNTMERLAYGLSGSESLSVHLRVDDGCHFDAFCVHLDDNSAQSSSTDHKWIESASAPDRLLCPGRQTRLTYLVSRGLWYVMQQKQDVTLKQIYDGVRHLMRTSAHHCVVCHKNIGAQLHRSTICVDGKCHSIWLRSALDMRLQDIRTDGRAVDLLLSSVYAAAAIGNLDLLPARPSRLSDPTKLMVLLDSLPATGVLAAAANFQTGLRGCGVRAELLLSWMCNSYRGFLASATGNFRIPHLPGVHQFVLIDSPPEVEANFTRHMAQPRQTILFHGTSMDRLYPILAEGLRVLSNTPLMKNGAASGSGIYTSTDPSTAWGYARGYGTNNTSFFTSRNDFMNAAVVLGLEYAGPQRHGVHVVADATTVIVRYVFVFPPGTAAPRIQDISGPMLSAFNYLRTSATARSSGGDVSSSSGWTSSAMPGAWPA